MDAAHAGEGVGGVEPDLTGYELVVAICGGIAAYKAAALVSKLVQCRAGVSVVMTDAAQRFVTPLTFASLSGRQVFTGIWDQSVNHDPQHLRLTERADLFIIAPATANMIGKMSCGLADDLVSTIALAVDSPVLMAPAMNVRMWQNLIVQDNLKRLVASGFRVVPPGEGWLACRSIGPGRMAEPDRIVNAAVEILKSAKPKSAG